MGGVISRENSNRVPLGNDPRSALVRYKAGPGTSSPAISQGDTAWGEGPRIN